jgi:hypothetical protein
MRDATTELEPGVIPKAIGSILWSDVGFEFYEKATVHLVRARAGRSGKCNRGKALPHQLDVLFRTDDPAGSFGPDLVWKCLPPVTFSGAASSGSNEMDSAWEWIAETDIPEVSQYLSEPHQLDVLFRTDDPAGSFGPDRGFLVKLKPDVTP